MTHVSQWNWKERMGQLAEAVGVTTRERRFLASYARAVLAYEDTDDVRDRFSTRGVGFNVADFYDDLLSQVGLDTVLEMTRAHQAVQAMKLPVYPDTAKLEEGTDEIRWYEGDFDVPETALLGLLENKQKLARIQKQLRGLRHVDSEIRRTLKPERKRRGL